MIGGETLGGTREGACVVAGELARVEGGPGVAAGWTHPVQQNARVAPTMKEPTAIGFTPARHQ